MVRRQSAAIILGNEPAFGNGEQRIVRFVILFAGEEIFIGGNQGQTARIGEFDEARFGRLFLLHAVALKLNVKAVPKDALQLIEAAFSSVLIVLPECFADGAVRPAGERNQTLMSIGQLVDGQRGPAIGHILVG
jgi:hypothetical protein